MDQISSSRSELSSRISLCHQWQSEKGKKSPDMIKKFDQIFKKYMLPEQDKNGQGYRVARHCKQGSGGVCDTTAGMLRKIASPEQGPLQQVPASAA